MKVIRTVDWEYVLLEGDGGEPLIDVFAGTIAMFPRRVRLTAEEYQRIRSDDAFAREFARDAVRHPEKFAGRYEDHPPRAFGAEE